MASFRPCNGCIARADCQIKAGVMKALRGLGKVVTSAKLKCDLPFTEHFPPGTRVSVMVWDQRDFTGSMGETPAKMASATVVGPSAKKRGKLLCHLDAPVATAVNYDSGQGTAFTEFRAAYPKDVTKLDEPRGEWCTSCKRAFVHDKCSCPEVDYGRCDW